MKKIIQVTGMHCGNCAKAVEKAIGEIDGISKVKADHEKNLVTASMKKDVDDKLIIEALFPVKSQSKKDFFHKMTIILYNY